MIPRPEHPYPQAERAQWLNLNGEWEFEIDSAKNGKSKKIYCPKDGCGYEETVKGKE